MITTMGARFGALASIVANFQPIRGLVANFQSIRVLASNTARPQQCKEAPTIVDDVVICIVLKMAILKKSKQKKLLKKIVIRW